MYHYRPSKHLFEITTVSTTHRNKDLVNADPIIIQKFLYDGNAEIINADKIATAATIASNRAPSTTPCFEELFGSCLSQAVQYQGQNLPIDSPWKLFHITLRAHEIELRFINQRHLAASGYAHIAKMIIPAYASGNSAQIFSCFTCTLNTNKTKHGQTIVATHEEYQFDSYLRTHCKELHFHAKIQTNRGDKPVVFDNIDLAHIYE